MTYAGMTQFPGTSCMMVLAHNPKRQEMEGGTSGLETKLCNKACPRPAGAIQQDPVSKQRPNYIGTSVASDILHKPKLWACAEFMALLYWLRQFSNVVKSGSAWLLAYKGLSLDMDLMAEGSQRRWSWNERFPPGEWLSQPLIAYTSCPC